MDNFLNLPKTKAEIDKLKNQPSTEERIAVIEEALTEIALSQLQVEDNQ